MPSWGRVCPEFKLTRDFGGWDVVPSLFFPPRSPVVKNPLSPVEHKGGAGVRNELFELGLDKFIRGLM